MDEIEMLLKESERFVTPDDYGESDRAVCYEFSPEQLKCLIELVENEQAKNCSKRASDGNYWFVQNAPKISEQIDWEEL